MYTELLLMSHLNNWKNGANYFQKQFSLDPDLFFWWKVSLLCFGPCWLNRGWPRQWSKHKVSFIIQKTSATLPFISFHIFHVKKEKNFILFVLEKIKILVLQNMNFFASTLFFQKHSKSLIPYGLTLKCALCEPKSNVCFINFLMWGCQAWEMLFSHT